MPYFRRGFNRSVVSIASVRWSRRLGPKSRLFVRFPEHMPIDAATLTDPRLIRVEMLKLRLLAKRRIDTKKGCWIWTGMTDGKGLGLIKIRNTRVLVHRLALALWKGIVLNRSQGAVPACGIQLCFYPEHLEIRSRSQSVKNGWATRRRNAGKTNRPGEE